MSTEKEEYKRTWKIWAVKYMADEIYGIKLLGYVTLHICIYVYMYTYTYIYIYIIYITKR